MIVIGLRSALARVAGLVAVFVVLAAGAATLMVCASVAEAGARDRVTPVRLAAADAVVVAAQGYPAAGEPYPEKVWLPIADVRRAATAPGVARAVGDVSVAARASGAGAGEWMVHGWGSALFGGYRLISGRAPSAPDELVTDTGTARVGDRVRLLVGGRPRRFTVTGLVTASTAVPAATAGTASRPGFVTDAEALSLAGDTGGVEAILIAAQRGVPVGQLSRGLAAALSGQRIDVLTGAQRGRAEQPVGQAGSGLLPLGAVSGGLCGMLTAIVAAGTVGLSLRQRATELALLRVIGATPGGLRRAVIGEIGLLAVAAAAAGLLLFRLIDATVFGRLTSAGLAPVGLLWNAGVFPIVVGAAGVLLVAVVSAWAAAFGPSRVAPMRALGAARRERRTLSVPRLVAALVCLTGGIVLAVATVRWARGEAAAATAAPAALVWAGFFAAISPLACRLTAVVVRAVPAGPGRWLAVRNLGARPAELGAGPATAVLLVVGLGCAFVLLPWNQASAGRVVAEESVHADAVLSFHPGLSASELGRLAGQPGVASVTPYSTSTGFLQSSDGDGYVDAAELPLVGVTAAGVARLARIQVTAGSLADLADGTIALPASRDPSRHVGGTVAVHFGDGRVQELRVVAAVTGRPGYPTAVTTVTTLLPHTTSGLIERALVTAIPREDAAFRTSLTRFTSSIPGAGVAATLAGPAGAHRAPDPGTWASYLIAVLVAGLAAVSMVNTIALTAAARRREFALLRTIGLDRARTLRTTGIETGLAAGCGLGLGLVLVAVAVIPFDLGILGTPILNPGRALALIAAVATATIILASTIAAAVAGRGLRGRQPAKMLAP